jgi:hypothetical protein
MQKGGYHVSFSGGPGAVRTQTITSSRFLPSVASTPARVRLPDVPAPRSLAFSMRPDLDPEVFRQLRTHFCNLKETVDVLCSGTMIPMVEELDIRGRMGKLDEAFQAFCREGNNERSTNLRGTARRFLQYWKTTALLIGRLRETGISSLSVLVFSKFDLLERLLSRVDDNPDLYTYQILRNACDHLRLVLSSTRGQFEAIFRTFPEGPSEETLAALIRDFMRDYNEAFYSIFPKSEKNPADLGALRAQVLSVCDDLFRVIRCLFAFQPDVAKVIEVFDSAHGMIQETGAHLGIWAVPRIAKPRVEPVPSPMEEFATRMWAALEEHPPGNDPVEGLEDALVNRISQREVHLSSTLPTRSRATAQNTIEQIRWAQEKRQLEEQLAEVTKIAEKRQQQLEAILSAKRIHAIEQVGRVMGDLLMPVETFVAQSDPAIEKVEKINVFVLERRCDKCREYEEEARIIRRRLKAFMEVRNGESLSSLFEALAENHRRAQADIAKKEARAEIARDALEKRKDVIAAANAALARFGITIAGDTPEDIAVSVIDALSALLNGHAKDLEQQQAELGEKHTQELQALLKSVGEIMPELAEGVNDSQPKAGIKLLAKIMGERVTEMKEIADRRDELLGRVQQWLRQQAVEMTDEELENLDYEEAIPLLLLSLDKTPNPLIPKINAIEAQIAQIETEFREFLEQAKRNGFLNADLDIEAMEIYELMNVNRSFQAQVIEQLQSGKRQLDMQAYDMEQTRQSLQTIGKRMRRLLRRDAVDLDGKDTGDLLMHINAFLEELTSGGTSGLFMSIADINDVTKNVRKTLNAMNANDPHSYLPDIMRAFEENASTLDSTHRFANPLESIFKSFDFQHASFNPECERFKFLREKIFQMHLLLGSDGTLIHDKKLTDVLKKMISLSSALVSYIAQQWLTNSAAGSPDIPAGGSPLSRTPRSSTASGIL